MNGYRAGHCNIGRHGRRRRLRVAVGAFAVAGLYVLAYLAGYLPGALLGGVFVPLALGFEWGVQAYASFCVRLALLNRYDFRGSGGDEGAVAARDARQADRVQAAKITGISVAAAAVVTVALVWAL